MTSSRSRGLSRCESMKNVVVCLSENNTSTGRACAGNPRSWHKLQRASLAWKAFPPCQVARNVPQSCGAGNNRALWLLVWLELLILSRCCSRKISNGNENEDVSYCHLHCTASEEDDEKEPTHKRSIIRRRGETMATCLTICPLQ